MNADTVVRATTWGNAGTEGANHLTSNLGLTNAGQVLPADNNTADDQGVSTPSTPSTPPALHDTPWSLGYVWR